MYHLLSPYHQDFPTDALGAAANCLDAVARIFHDDEAPDLTDAQSRGIYQMLACIAGSLRDVAAVIDERGLKPLQEDHQEGDGPVYPRVDPREAPAEEDTLRGAAGVGRRASTRRA